LKYFIRWISYFLDDAADYFIVWFSC